MLSKKTRIIRALIGLAIMIAGAVFSSWWGLIGLAMMVAGVAFSSWWGLVGLVPFIVGVTGFCPACYFLNRCSLKR